MAIWPNWRLSRDVRQQRASDRRNIALINASGLFEEAWYRSSYVDLDFSKEGPVFHYLRIGGLADFDPSPRFSTSDYLAHYPDVLNENMNALVHYLRFGIAEARSIFPSKLVVVSETDTKLLQESDLFDEEWYLSYYPDVAVARLDPINHYVSYGALEGRNPGPNFDTNRYFVNHPGLRVEGTNPLVHFLQTTIVTAQN